MRDKETGFTLLETLVVVTIVVILAAISVLSPMQTKHSARRGVIFTDLQIFTDALSRVPPLLRSKSEVFDIDFAGSRAQFPIMALLPIRLSSDLSAGLAQTIG